MKYILLFLIIALTMSSCQQKVSSFKIIGTMTSTTTDSVQIIINEKVYPVPVNDKGIFEFSGNINEPQYYSLKIINEIPLYTSPGDIQNIVIYNDTISFSGDAAVINEYLQIRKSHYNDVMSRFDDNEAFSLSEDKFVHKIDSVISQLAIALQQYLDKGLITDQIFVKYEKNRLKYQYFDLLSTFHRYSPSFTQIITIPSPTYFDFLDSADFIDPKLLNLLEYKEFIVSYVLDLSFLSSIDNPINDLNKTRSMIDIAENKFSEQHIRSYVITKIIERQLNLFQINDSLIQVYQTKYSGVQSIKNVLLNYEKIKPLLIGNNAPNFTVTDMKGLDVTLSDFSGKTVYIDVWSPFCSTCIPEFPFYKMLQDEFKNTNIAFLSICLDDSDKRWKEHIGKNKLTGNLLRPQKGWKSEFVNEYHIQSVPCCILIDKNGKIITARAPRPSSSVLKELLKKNL